FTHLYNRGILLMGGLMLSRFEARVRFVTDADLPLWAGNSLRSGFGLRMKEMVCVKRDDGFGLDEGCGGCSHRERCVYDLFYNFRPPDGDRVLKKQAEIPRPFVLDPPAWGKYGIGEGAVLGFTLIGQKV